jgi:hypothetical protein
MTFANYLKAQLTDFVDTYKKYYVKTNGTTVVFTLVTFVFIALLFHSSIFDKTSTKKNISLLSYFFARYSIGDTYSIVDLSKTVFIFFVSVFSISLIRQERNKLETNNLNFSDFLKNIKGNDFLYLFVVLAISIIADYLLFKLDDLSAKNFGGLPSDRWIHGLLFLLRVYIPLMLFSFINYKILAGKKKNFNLQKFIWLFAALWLFNEFAYGFSLLVRGHIFELILLPFPADSRYFVESILGVALISFYFLGYHSAMTNSMLLLNNDDLENNTAGNKSIDIGGS